MKNSKKQLIVISLIALLITMFSSFGNVSASTFVGAEYVGGTQDGYTLPGSGPDYGQKVGQSFNVTSSGYLKEIDVKLKKQGSPVAELNCIVVPLVGTYGSDASTGNLSNVIDTCVGTKNTNTISSGQYLNFTFNGNVYLNSSISYMFLLGTSSYTTFDATTNYMRLHILNIGAYGGTGHQYKGTTWTGEADYDVGFVVKLDTETSMPTPSPSPTPIPAALSYTLDMRGVGAVANPSSTTSAYGKEWFPKQGLGYTFNGHVWNYTNPYCNGAYAAYAGELRSKATGNTTVEAWTDLTNDDLTEVTTGSLVNGYFQFGTSAQTQYDSVELYQAWRINGTVTGSTETYTTDFIVRWVEPGVIVVEPTGSAELPTPTPVGYQPVGYGYIVWYIVALIVVLLPAGILGVMFRFGAWGFIIGLAIGAGLGYMLMPTIVPLWLVFVVVIGIVGMLLKGTVMGGGTQGTEP